MAIEVTRNTERSRCEISPDSQADAFRADASFSGAADNRRAASNVCPTDMSPLAAR
jgi:hypothetical protein